jgi:hypothetical protein
MRLTLVDHGYPFKKIMKGKDWVGRVVKMGDGTGYLGIIKPHEYKAATEQEAFEEVGARYMGHESYAALRNKNRAVRSFRRAANQAGDYAIQQMERNNFEPLEKMLTHPATAPALVSAFSRSLGFGKKRKRRR